MNLIWGSWTHCYCILSFRDWCVEGEGSSAASRSRLCQNCLFRITKDPGAQITWKEMWVLVGGGVSDNEVLCVDLHHMPKNNRKYL